MRLTEKCSNSPSDTSPILHRKQQKLSEEPLDAFIEHLEGQSTLLTWILQDRNLCGEEIMDPEVLLRAHPRLRQLCLACIELHLDLVLSQQIEGMPNLGRSE